MHYRKSTKRKQIISAILVVVLVAAMVIPTVLELFL